MLRSVGLSGLAFLLCFATPASAIVTLFSSTSGDVNASSPTVDGVDLNGVVQIALYGTYEGDIGCSGSLLSDGFSILTAAHCVDASYRSALPTSASVGFLQSNGSTQWDTVSAYYVDPGWTGNPTQGGDLAILRLATAAPSTATEYSLYTGPMPTGPVLMAGYGLSGTGSEGAQSNTFGTLAAGTNEYFKTGSIFGYTSSLYVGQFYDGDSSTNALLAYGVNNPYYSTDEVDIAFGDSGGPSFYNGEIVGVHDLGICSSGTSGCATPPSVSTSNNSYFGEMFADTSVADNLAFLDDPEGPEPASFGMLGLGLAALAVLRFRSSPSRKRIP
jgi:secreted trypsin-like serine protease